MSWASSTLAEVDFATGRVVQHLNLGHLARIDYGKAMADTQPLTDEQLDKALAPPATVLDRIGGRKFALTLITLAAATWLVYDGKLPADTWMWVAVVAMTGYAGINVVQKAVEKAAGK